MIEETIEGSPIRDPSLRLPKRSEPSFYNGETMGTVLRSVPQGLICMEYEKNWQLCGARETVKSTTHRKNEFSVPSPARNEITTAHGSQVDELR
jgi:hypothetical protein